MTLHRYRRATVPPNVHPLVRRLFEEMRRQRVSPRDVAIRAGLGTSSVFNWRRHTPTLANLEAALNVLGLRLLVERVNDD